MSTGRDRLPAQDRRHMEEEILLGNRNADDLSSRYDAARLLVVRAIRDLTSGGGDPLERWIALEGDIRRSLAEGLVPDEAALAQAHGFPQFVVGREVAHVKAAISGPAPAAPEKVRPAKVVVQDPFVDVGPVWISGDHCDVVFAPSLSGSRRPALEYLADLFRSGGDLRKRAVEFQEAVFTYARTGNATRDSMKDLAKDLHGFKELRTFKHRMFCRLATVQDARSGAQRTTLVLLSAFEKKRDDTVAREGERAIALFGAWEGRMRAAGHVVSNPGSDGEDHMQVLRDMGPDAVESATVRLMQDLQAVVRDAMHREGVGAVAMAQALRTTPDDVERILWDTTTPLEELVQAALAVGISLGGRESAS